MFVHGLIHSPLHIQKVQFLQDAARLHTGQVLALGQIAADYQHQVAGLNAQQRQSIQQLDQVRFSICHAVSLDC